MKKSILLLLVMLLFAANVFAQTYPEVPISKIQHISNDSLLTSPYDYPSAIDGDTVTITGIVTAAPYFYSKVDSGETLIAGYPAFFLQDPDDPEFGGMLCRYEDGDNNALFALMDTGWTVKVTGVVLEYYTTTEFDLISFGASNIVNDETVRPEPVELNIDDLFADGSGLTQANYLGEKWEHVYVEFNNVTVTNSVSLGDGSYGIIDDNGTTMLVSNRGTYWRNQGIPQPGTTIESIKGFIQTRNNASTWFMIDPVYPNDIVFGSVLPPDINNVKRDLATVGYGNSVVITADVTDEDGLISSAQLVYQANDGEPQTVSMSQVTTTQYSATIPGFSDSTLVSYYIKALDSDNNKTVFPQDTVNGKYFYFVLNRPITIQDVQKNPFGTGFSSYDGFSVTVSGIITSDTSTVSLSAQVNLQNGTGPWSGIWLFSDNVLGLKEGDSVSVTGTVDEDYDVTRIEEITSVTVISSNNDLPEPYLISTEDVGTLGNGVLPAESYESVLVKYENVTVSDDNADGDTGPYTDDNNNYGEILVYDASNVSTRVEIEQGNNDYHNFWDESQEGTPLQIKVDDTLEELIGIMYYSFYYYKLVPRTNADFVGYVTDVEDEPVVANEFSLSQNYPNPFNPTTTIEFSIPTAGQVSLKVYNILGQQVMDVVNQEMTQGIHRVTLDASKLSSGVYFYRLKSGNFVSTQKMLLLK